MSDVRAIILAAGRGSRMGALTALQPKCMTQFVGKPLLDHQMSALLAGGVSNIAAVTGYKGESLKRDNLTAFSNPRWDQTNMVYSLTCASDWLERYSCLVSYSDIFYSPDTVKRLNQSKADIALTYDPDWLTIWQARFEDPLSDAETFCLDAAGQYLTEIGNKAASVDVIKGQYMGLLRITPFGWKHFADFLATLESTRVDSVDMTLDLISAD